MTAARPNAEPRKAFARDGSVVVPSVVNRTQIDAALQAINHWLDAGYDSTERATYHARTFAPGLVADPLIMGLLLDSPAFDLAGALVGRPLDRPPEAQIALRFPVAPGTQPEGPWPHIDGVPSPHNGARPTAGSTASRCWPACCCPTCPSRDTATSPSGPARTWPWRGLDQSARQPPGPDRRPRRLHPGECHGGV